jgi:hypothetical protein
MSSFDALDVAVQRNITRSTVEFFLHDLAEQLGSPDHWQMAAANRAIAAYQSGKFDYALVCISVGEKPLHQRPLLAAFTEAVGQLSLRDLWGRLVCPSCDSAESRAGADFGYERI